MKNNWTHERISRKAEAYQWDGTNTDQIIGFLAQNEMIGEVYREGVHILVYRDGRIFTSVNRGSWVLKGEDGKIRFYDDATFKMMYQPILTVDEWCDR